MRTHRFLPNFIRPTYGIAMLATLAMAGCAVGPDFQRPAPPPTTDYVAGTLPPATASAPGAGGQAQTFVTGANTPPQWWKQFGSPDLDRLVRDALAHSPTLAQARATLRQAQADLDAQRGGTMLPSVDVQLSATRQKIDTAAFGIQNIPGIPQPGPFTLYHASVDVAYTLDVFGGNRRALEASQAETDHQRFALAAARLALAGNVVTTAIRQAAVREQIALTEALLAEQQRQLTIAQARLRAGGVAVVDVQSQQSQLATTRASLPPLQQQQARLAHQLSVYLGVPPSQAPASPALNALRLPADLPLSLPSTLARRRPDILAAEAVLHRASAEVGVATANLYPRFTLSGSLGTERTRLADVPSGMNVWDIGLGLMQPLFHGGELRARRRSAVAAYDAAAAAYQQTVLHGLQEVADTLRALQSDADRLNATSEADTHAQAVEHIVARQYALGGVSRLALLDARQRRLQAGLARIEALADRYSDTVALFQALGGGQPWQDTPARHSTGE